MIHLLAQAAADAPAFDWKSIAVAVLATLVPLAVAFGKKLGNKALIAAEDKLALAGHPQAADTLRFLSAQVARTFTAAEKAALAREAADQGIDHPAIDAAHGLNQ